MAFSKKQQETMRRLESQGARQGQRNAVKEQSRNKSILDYASQNGLDPNNYADYGRAQEMMQGESELARRGLPKSMLQDYLAQQGNGPRTPGSGGGGGGNFGYVPAPNLGAQPGGGSSGGGVGIGDFERGQIKPNNPSNPSGGYGQTPDNSGYTGGPPTLPSFQWQGDQSNDMLNSVFGQATGGTINAYNTAANRLRERLDSASKGAAQQATNRNLSRGFGNSGLQNADQFRVQQSGQSAYAQGLNDLSNMFEQNRLSGLQTALGSANSVREGGQFRNGLGQLDLSQLRNLFNSNFQFGANQNFQAGQNNANRSLQMALAQLGEQGNNYRQSLGMGQNQYPQLISNQGLGNADLTGNGISAPITGSVNTNLNYGLPNRNTFNSGSY